jgi:hypothetical protein
MFGKSGLATKDAGFHENPLPLAENQGKNPAVIK